MARRCSSVRPTRRCRSSRHPEELGDVVKATPRSKAASIEEAARDGEALFLGAPYSAMPQLATPRGARRCGEGDASLEGGEHRGGCARWRGAVPRCALLGDAAARDTPRSSAMW